MNKLINQINKLKNSEIKQIVDSRIKEFEAFLEKDNNELFKELCFCLLTANFSAKGGIKIQKQIDDGFLFLSEKILSSELLKSGHRFPNTRANYIVEARKYKDSLRILLNSFENEHKIREWLVKNTKGLGMKEASHFLRNIGYKNISIIDFHIVDLLVKSGLIERPKSLTLKKYLEIENVLKKIAEKTQIPLGELDLYLWYSETGEILK